MGIPLRKLSGNELRGSGYCSYSQQKKVAWRANYPEKFILAKFRATAPLCLFRLIQRGEELFESGAVLDGRDE